MTQKSEMLMCDIARLPNQTITARFEASAHDAARPADIQTSFLHQKRGSALTCAMLRNVFRDVRSKYLPYGI